MSGKFASISMVSSQSNSAVYLFMTLYVKFYINFLLHKTESRNL